MYYTWKLKDVKATTVILFNYIPDLLASVHFNFFTGGVNFRLSLVTYFSTSKLSHLGLVSRPG